MNKVNVKQHVQHPQYIDQRAANRHGIPIYPTVIMWISITQEIPRTLKKRVKSILFAFGGLTAFWAFCIFPCWMIGQGVAFCRKINIVRKGYWQIRLGHGHCSTFEAVNDWNWASPIALSRHTPISQPVSCFADTNIGLW